MSGGRSSLVLRTHRPGDIGWVISRHGALYAREYGFDATFEAFVARVAADFLDSYDPARERCWVAEADGAAVGSVMLVRGTDEVGKLRMLIVEPQARGLGAGRALVEACVAFAAQAGYRRVTLWTHDILHAARRIYSRTGFVLVRTDPHRSWGRDLMGEEWELALPDRD